MGGHRQPDRRLGQRGRAARPPAAVQMLNRDAAAALELRLGLGFEYKSEFAGDPDEACAPLRRDARGDPARGCACTFASEMREGIIFVDTCPTKEVFE